jgi:hypothetical protein
MHPSKKYIGDTASATGSTGTKDDTNEDRDLIDAAMAAADSGSPYRAA